jgi:hypothetical protein
VRAAARKHGSGGNPVDDALKNPHGVDERLMQLGMRCGEDDRTRRRVCSGRLHGLKLLPYLVGALSERLALVFWHEMQAREDLVAIGLNRSQIVGALEPARLSTHPRVEVSRLFHCAPARGAEGAEDASAWKPIVSMAERAQRAGKRDLAFAIFRAADVPGWHRDYLRDECKRVTGRAPASAPLLRRVK